jgi:hypothetical protein
MLQIGDFVQWTCNGVDMFEKPRKVVSVLNKEYCRVRGTKTGIPVNECTIIRRPSTSFLPSLVRYCVVVFLLSVPVLIGVLQLQAKREKVEQRQKEKVQQLQAEREKVEHVFSAKAFQQNGDSFLGRNLNKQLEREKKDVAEKKARKVEQQRQKEKVLEQLCESMQKTIWEVFTQLKADLKAEREKVEQQRQKEKVQQLQAEREKVEQQRQKEKVQQLQAEREKVEQQVQQLQAEREKVEQQRYVVDVVKIWEEKQKQLQAEKEQEQLQAEREKLVACCENIAELNLVLKGYVKTRNGRWIHKSMTMILFTGECVINEESSIYQEAEQCRKNALRDAEERRILWQKFVTDRYNRSKGKVDSIPSPSIEIPPSVEKQWRMEASGHGGFGGRGFGGSFGRGGMY